MEHDTTADTTYFEGILRAQVSRRTLFKAAGAAGVGVWLAQAGLLRDAAAASDTVQDILNITITVEHFGVTFLGYGIDNIKQGKFSKPVPPAVLAVLEAARVCLAGDARAWADFAAWLVGQPAPALQRVFDTFVACARSGQARRPAGRLAGMHELRRCARAHLSAGAWQGLFCSAWFPALCALML